MPRPKLAARSNQQSEPSMANWTMVTSESGYDAYRGGHQPVLSCSSPPIFLHAIFILHLDTFSVERNCFFFSVSTCFHVFLCLEVGGRWDMKTAKWVRRADSKKKGEKGLEGPEVN